MTLKVSVITACLNNEKTIADTLRSVAEQRYPDIEHIVVDGGSSDATLQIVRGSAGRVSRLIGGPDGGIYDALNKGVLAASGSLIGILHADDVYDGPDTIGKVVEALGSAEGVYGDLVYVHPKDVRRVVRYWRAGAFGSGKMAEGWMPPHPATFFASAVYRRKGLYDAGFKIAADYDLLMRFLSDGTVGMRYLPEVLVRMRSGGVSNRNLAGLIRKSAEDHRILVRHGVPRPLRTLVKKNISKLPQWFAGTSLPARIR